MSQKVTFEDVNEFVQAWQKLYDDYMARQFPSLTKPKLTFKMSHKFAKVISEGSVMAFINLESGDVFKPAGWQKPAPHARGNLFSPQRGLEALEKSQSIHPHVRYLR